jgi:hypothetical protein
MCTVTGFRILCSAVVNIWWEGRRLSARQRISSLHRVGPSVQRWKAIGQGPTSRSTISPSLTLGPHSDGS